MLSLATKGFNQKLFNFNSHKNLFTCSRFPLRAVAAMSSPSTTHVSSPGFSTSSPINAPLKCVGTHNDSFHYDKALSCFMIRLTNRFSNAQIIRTRDSKVLDELDVVLDVGGVYDPSNDRYDHHQKGFEEIFGHEFTTKLSSAGLVYMVLDELDTVLDVGGVYDPSNDWYDHHQKGFEEIFGHGFSTKLSSADLVYKERIANEQACKCWTLKC